MKSLLLLLCMLLYGSLGYSQGRDTFTVYFPLNDARINKEAARYIDELVFKDTLIHGDKLIIFGYTDYLGGRGHNDTLSRMRARNIQAYLGTMGFDKNDIRLCIGKGKIEELNAGGKEGNAINRKVQIIIDRTPPPTPINALAVYTRKPVKTAPKLPAQPLKEVAVVLPPLPPDRIEIDDVKVNETFALNKIYFAGGSPIILPESEGDLQALLSILNENPNVKIRIEGHVCCVGPIEGVDERDLSYYRAVTIFNYLTDRGISKDRLAVAGLGNRNPVVKDEQTEEDRIKNRRVEIRVMSK
jgi:outer membrane protein OmpA-like peptidoglycan-associated protein